MRSTAFGVAALAAVAAAAAPSPQPGYYTNVSSVTGDFTFGRHYANLVLDNIAGLVGSVASTPAGKRYVNATAAWIDAVHAKDPQPLSVFTRVYFQSAQRPEIKPGSVFDQITAGLGNVTESSAATQLYPAFTATERNDVTLQKARIYAGAGNELELILSSQAIDTVILSGISTSAVILSTALTLADLNYRVFVIADTVIETPSATAAAIDRTIKADLLPKLHINVITLKQAMAALARSGPAIY